MSSIARISSLSRFMSWACFGLIVILPICVGWIWINFEQYLLPAWEMQQVGPLKFQYVSAAQLALGAMLNLAVLSVFLVALWNLRALFKEFQTGNFFSVSAIHHLYRFAILLLTSVVLGPILRSVLSVVLTYRYPPGQKSLVINIGSAELIQLLIAVTLVVIAWIFREGHRINQENASFI